MMTLVREDTLKPWGGEPLNGVRHPRNIGDLWSDDELKAIGLVRPAAFVVPSRKRKVGEPRYALKRGKVHEEYDVEDEPLPSSKEEKVGRLLDTFDLTLDELKSVLADPAPPAPKPGPAKG